MSYPVSGWSRLFLVSCAGFALLACQPQPVLATGPSAEESPGYTSLDAALTASRHQIRDISEPLQGLEINRDARFFAANPGQAFSIRFLPGAVRMQRAVEQAPAWTLTLRAMGRDAEQAVDPARMHVQGTRIEYHRGDVIEWYENRTAGLEQGFTVLQPPSMVPSHAPLRLWLDVQGLRVEEGSDEDTLRLVTANGKQEFLYNTLKVVDARGHALPSSMTTDDPHTICIEVRDMEALYPITIDPLIQNGMTELRPLAGAGTEDALFGASIAIDGDTAVVGVPDDVTSVNIQPRGSAYVFVRTPGNQLWTLQQRLLTTYDLYVAGIQFGLSVAIEGDSMLVGAPGMLRQSDAVRVGAVVAYQRFGDEWLEMDLLQPDAIDEMGRTDNFGAAVAISIPHAVVGAPGKTGVTDDGEILEDYGAVYFFAQAGFTWSDMSLPGNEPWIPRNTLDDYRPHRIGSAVAMGDDWAFVGMPGAFRYRDRPGLSSYDFGVGAVAIFVYRPEQDGFWHASGLSPSEDDVENEDASFGASLAYDEDHVVVGCRNSDSAQGAESGSVFIYQVTAEAGNPWPVKELKAHLTAGDDRQAGAKFGHAVALDGDRVAVSAPYEDTVHGAVAGCAYVFGLAGDMWEETHRIPGEQIHPGDGYGRSVAIQEDTLWVGAPLDNTEAANNAGSVYLFDVADTTAEPLQKLSAGASPAGDRFGQAVALSDDTLIVGAPEDDTEAGTSAGLAYVFRHSMCTGWCLEGLLQDPDGRAGDIFGTAVDVDGDTAVVSALSDDTVFGGADAGSALIFDRTMAPDGRHRWAAGVRLEPLFASPLDFFGISVALDGNTAIVGSMHDDTSAGENAGRAHVFVRGAGSWLQQAMLEDPGGSAFDNFGSAVALDGDTALIGAEQDSSIGSSHAGSASVFTRSGTTWTRRTKLTSGESESYQNFGHAVALQDGTALVGAPWDDTIAADNAGSVYVFTGSAASWTRDVRLFASDPAEDAQFGASVALDGSVALIGADGAPSPGSGKTETGQAYLFVGTGSAWSEEVILSVTNASGFNEDAFGAAVAIDQGHIAVGAPDRASEDGSLASVGSVSMWQMASGLIVYNGPSTGSPPLANQQPAPVQFSAPGGSSLVKTFTLENIGSTVLSDLSVRLTGAQVGDFGLSQPVLTTLNPGGTTTFTINYVPVGGYSYGEVEVAASGYGGFTFPVYGRNTSLPKLIPDIAVSSGPGAVVYVERLYDEQTPLFFTAGATESRTATFTLRNAGNDLLDDIVFTLIGATGPWSVAAPPANTALFPGASVEFDITFEHPTAASYSAFLGIASNDPDEDPFVIPLYGANSDQAPLAPEIEVYDGPSAGSPPLPDDRDDPLYFTGSGITPAIKTLTVKNTGSFPLMGLALTVSGPQADAFAASDLGLSVLHPGSLRTFTVGYTPNGPYSTAHLTISNNDPDESPYEIGLFGYNTDYPKHVSEIAVYVGPDTTGTPLADGQLTPVNLERVPESSVRAREVTVENTGSALLTDLDVTLSGIYAGDFSTTPLPTVLMPDDSATFTVSFTHPGDAGERSALVHIASNDVSENPFIFPVTGEAWTALEEWRFAYFGNIADEGMGANSADPEGDQIPNLFEFAFGLQPGIINERSEVPWPAFSPDRSTLDVSFARPSGVEGIVYAYGVATTLHPTPDWSDIPDSDPDPLGYLFSTAGPEDVLFIRLVISEE